MTEEKNKKIEEQASQMTPQSMQNMIVPKIEQDKAGQVHAYKKLIEPFFIHIDDNINKKPQILNCRDFVKNSFNSSNNVTPMSHEFHQELKDFYFPVSCLTDAEQMLKNYIENNVDIVVVNHTSLTNELSAKVKQMKFTREYFDSMDAININLESYWEYKSKI